MIESVQISGFRSCSNTELYLGRPFTAIVGRNGVGKTNIMRGIQWIANTACGTSFSSHPSPIFQHADRSALVDVRIDSVRYVYSLSISNSSHSRIQIEEDLTMGDQHDTSVIFQRSGPDITIVDPRIDINVNHKSFALPVLLSLLPEENEVFLHAKRLNEFFTNTYYYDLRNPVDRHKYIRASEHRDWRHQYVEEGEPGTSVLNRLIYAYENDRDMYDELRSILGSDGLRIVDDIDVLTLEINRPIRTKDGKYKVKPEPVYAVLFYPASYQAGSGESFMLGDLSAGTQRIVRIVTYMLFDRRTLMLIEQPEDSIHTGLTHKLIDVLREYADQTQVVISTHSRDVMDLLQPEELRLVYSKDGHTKAKTLSDREIDAAKMYLRNDGPLSDVVESLT